MEKEGCETIGYVCSAIGTTEFRMMLTAMIHAMYEVPESSTVIFMTNVAYLQNFGRMPAEGTANADLVLKCIDAKKRLGSVSVKVVPYHKHPRLAETHEMAHRAMKERKPAIHL